MRRFTVLLLAAFAIGGLGVVGSKAINAQPSFSDVSLSGDYAFHFGGNGSSNVSLPVAFQNLTCTPTGCGSCGAPVCIAPANFPITTPRHGVGEFQADGAGNIAGSGTIFSQSLSETQVPGAPPTFSVLDDSCGFTFSGTYLINPDGSGTMTLIPSGSCFSPGSTIAFSLKLAGKGTVGVFASVTPDGGGGFAAIIAGGFAKK
jgi:hypothetical protein